MTAEQKKAACRRRAAALIEQKSRQIPEGYDGEMGSATGKKKDVLPDYPDLSGDCSQTEGDYVDVMALQALGLDSTGMIEMLGYASTGSAFGPQDKIKVYKELNLTTLFDTFDDSAATGGAAAGGAAAGGAAADAGKGKGAF
eukprot:CAMPEP_0175150578 /NCGR_PEP_ID=MMETSP0087-20121206/17973_1 /TAXON_ID=136419 /ORGANISM="Unknown Unknown, Strain D1" /LENGTH=141 /DNA_ID=CAMNT_0016436589 /DNA_START=116 /DNA_END=541 /DNA_ORIENTATION=+